MTPKQLTLDKAFAQVDKMKKKKNTILLTTQA